MASREQRRAAIDRAVKLVERGVVVPQTPRAKKKAQKKAEIVSGPKFDPNEADLQEAFEQGARAAYEELNYGRWNGYEMAKPRLDGPAALIERMKKFGRVYKDPEDRVDDEAPFKSKFSTLVATDPDSDEERIHEAARFVLEKDNATGIDPYVADISYEGDFIVVEMDFPHRRGHIEKEVRIQLKREWVGI